MSPLAIVLLSIAAGALLGSILITVLWLRFIHRLQQDDIHD
jgi:hypothetical protein